jgi:hypothetical protein
LGVVKNFRANMSRVRYINRPNFGFGAETGVTLRYRL